MLPYEMIAGGTIIATQGVAQSISLQAQNPPDFFIMRNITGWGLTTAARTIEIWWERSMAQGSARFINQSSDAAAPAMSAHFLTTGGIQTYDTLNPPVFAGLAASAINATTGVVTMANTGTIAVGDRVRVINPVGMLQIGGLPFTVTAVTTNVSITLGYIGVAGAGVNGTTATIVKFIPNLFTPPARVITNITQATQAVIEFSATHAFIVGEEVSFRVPTQYGMTQMDNRKGTVQAINTTNNTITMDIDSSGFSAFVYPASALVQSGHSPAVAVPAGSGVFPGAAQPHTTVEDAFDNQNTRIIYLGVGLFGAAVALNGTLVQTGDVFQWTAFKYSQYNGM